MLLLEQQIERPTAEHDWRVGEEAVICKEAMAKLFPTFATKTKLTLQVYDKCPEDTPYVLIEFYAIKNPPRKTLRFGIYHAKYSTISTYAGLGNYLQEWHDKGLTELYVVAKDAPADHVAINCDSFEQLCYLITQLCSVGFQFSGTRFTRGYLTEESIRAIRLFKNRKVIEGKNCSYDDDSYGQDETITLDSFAAIDKWVKAEIL